MIQAQTDLANDKSLELQAMAAYIHARIQFDQALGTTLDTNHVTMDEALSGRVERQSFIPDSVPRNSDAKEGQ